MSRLATLILVLALAAGLPVAGAAQPASADPPVMDPPASVAASSASAEALVRHVIGDAAPVYYVVDHRPVLRGGPGVGRSEGRLDFRRGVRIRGEEGAWRLVEDVETGETLGWVEASALSNVWLLIDKSSRMLFVYHGTEIIRRLPVDVSMNPEDDKERLASGDQDHYRIPEGSYFVSGRNPNSQYYRSFMINYPNVEDADRGLANGLISRSQHRAIVEANENFRTPPLTSLGGAIAIHGQGSGRQRAWTKGCVALRDVHMDMLWEMVHVGTPVLIR